MKASQQQNKREDWLFVKEVALIARVHPRTVRRWIEEKKFGIRFRRAGTLKYQIHRESVEKILEEQ